ncbi:MAG TPA: hypothetical protein VEQ60_17915 [Longimicrobium sp.]|nr:hypothetical protein [Longimicrobium sp.]
MPIETLRAFMDQLVLDTSLRDVAALVGLGHEALRKFINGTTERPHARSLRAMGQLYNERQAQAKERAAVPTAGQLRLLLPRGLEDASAAVREAFDAIRGTRKGGAYADNMERFLLLRLEEEYAVDTSWAPTRKRSRK